MHVGDLRIRHVHIFIENQVQARSSTGSAAKHQIGIGPLVGHFDRNAEFARRLKSSFGTGAISWTGNSVTAYLVSS
jgi:hypothetical protein